MSQSLMYHSFGIPCSYEYLKSTYEGGRVQFWIRTRLSYRHCSGCKSYRVISRGSKCRLFKTVPMGMKLVEMVLEVHRLECGDCKSVLQEGISFSEGKRRHTKAFERYVIGLSACMTIQDIAWLLQTGWDTIKEIQKRYLKRKFSKPKLHKLKWIGIDEIAIGSGHKYWTIVMDLQKGNVVYVGEGKAEESLAPFFRRLGRYRRNIEAVSIDMSKAYFAAVGKYLPHAEIVIDHFHVVKLMNERLADLRTELHRQIKRGYKKEVLKGSKWLLLKNPEHLDEQKNEKQRLNLALALNKPLATAYYLKEDLRQIWSQKDKQTAGRVIEDWIKKAYASGIRLLMKMADTLATYRNAILAYYDYPISTGPLEGLNNKIKTLKRQAYGYRDSDFFKLKILAIHQSKYALIG